MENLYSTQRIDWHDVNIYERWDWQYKIVVDDFFVDIVWNPEIAEIIAEYFVKWAEYQKNLNE